MHTCLKSGLFFALFFLIITSSYLPAQSIRKPSQYTAEAGTYLSSSVETPFWLRANQYGIVSNQSPVFTFRAGLQSNYDTARHSTGRWRESKFDVGYGMNVVVNAGLNQLPYEKSVLLPEAYVKVRRGIFEGYIGRQREKFGLADSTLSTGSYAWSGNALPIPKIQISIPVFTPIGFTKGWVAVQGTFAHGFLPASGYVQNPMLHQKSLYIRFGRPQEVIRAYGGFNHQAIWGGQSDQLKGTGLVPSDGQLPSSLRDYYYVVVGDRFSRTDSSAYTYFEITNRVGNHLGSIDVGLEVDLVRHTLYFYRQSFYEDGSLFSLINIADGLHGLRIRRNDPDALVRDILFEFLNTTSQGGPEFIINDPQKRGKDDYFNHQQYRDGWSYRQHTIGTPFIPPALGAQNQYPQGTFTANNRVYVFHTGLAGSLPIRGRALTAPVSYQAKFSYSRNFGTYNVPYESVRDQFSAYLSIVAPLTIMGGLQVTGSVAADAGTLYRNSFGTFISVRKSWHANGYR